MTLDHFVALAKRRIVVGLRLNRASLLGNSEKMSVAMKLSNVIEAKHDGRFRLRLVFNDKTAKTVDFHPWLKGPVFAPLKDERYFQRFFLDGGTVAWPNGADITPETLYEGEDVGSMTSKSRVAQRKRGRVGTASR